MSLVGRRRGACNVSLWNKICTHHAPAQGCSHKGYQAGQASEGTEQMRIEQFFLEGLGHQSYLITEETRGVAAVVDPRRDVDPYLEAASRAGVQITHVFETHVHNDYVSGARELAVRVGATIVTAAEAQVLYEHHPVRDGDQVRVGNLLFTVLATPGHTPSHISYVLAESGHDQPAAVFTGGSMLVASAGRTDLAGPALTLTLTRQQYHSLLRLLETLPDQVRVYPTHGAGSFCGATTAEPSAHYTTIGQERIASPAAHAPDEAAFVRQQLAGYGVYPRYYGYMRDINLHGPRILGGLPQLPPLSPQAVQHQMNQGIPLIDGRSREAFAREFIPGSLHIELDATFGTYVGWLLPFNAPLLLMVEDAAGRREAVAQLIRIGYEQLNGYLEGGIAAWKAEGLPVGDFERIDVDEFYRRWKQDERLAVLDVRDAHEWRSGHIPGSQHIHIGDLMHHLPELPLDGPIATICGAGYRAAMAASIIAALGRTPIAVQGGVPDWIARGLPTERGEAGEADPLVAGHAHP
jgi:hydroxyacylglutathione hydrolase